MRRTLTALLAVFITLGTPEGAGSRQLRFHLSVTVAPTCQIIEQRRQRLTDGDRIDVSIDCNVESYAILLDEHASGSIGSVRGIGVTTRYRRASREIAVDNRRPGKHAVSFRVPAGARIGRLTLIAYGS